MDRVNTTALGGDGVGEGRRARPVLAGGGEQAASLERRLHAAGLKKGQSYVKNDREESG